MKQTFRTPFPACNELRRNELVATDTVYSSTAFKDSGSTLAQIYIGRKSLVVDIYPIKNEHKFITALQDNLRER